MSKGLCLELSPTRRLKFVPFAKSFERQENGIKLTVAIVSEDKAYLLIESSRNCPRDVCDQLYFLFRGLGLKVYNAGLLESCQNLIASSSKNTLSTSDENVIDLEQLITCVLVRRLTQEMDKFKLVVGLLHLLHQLDFTADDLKPLVLKLLIDAIIDRKAGEITQEVKEEAKNLFDSLTKEKFGPAKEFEFKPEEDSKYWQIAKECLNNDRSKDFVLLRIYRNIIAHIGERGKPAFFDSHDYVSFLSDCNEVGKCVVLKKWIQASDEVIKHLII